MFATANQSLETRTLARDLRMGTRRTQSGRIRKRRRTKKSRSKVHTIELVRQNTKLTHKSHTAHTQLTHGSQYLVVLLGHNTCNC